MNKKDINFNKMTFWGMLCYLIVYHWWKLILVLCAIGISIGGWNISKDGINKNQIKVKGSVPIEKLD